MPGPCHREGSKCAASSSSEGEFFPYLPPGDPTRIDDCALLNFPHEVAQVGGEEQQMGNPRQINKGVTRARSSRRQIFCAPVYHCLCLQLFIVYIHFLWRWMQRIERSLKESNFRRTFDYLQACLYLGQQVRGQACHAISWSWRKAYLLLAEVEQDVCGGDPNGNPTHADHWWIRH